jgi:hypothetical protein
MLSEVIPALSSINVLKFWFVETWSLNDDSVPSPIIMFHFKIGVKDTFTALFTGARFVGGSGSNWELAIEESIMIIQKAFKIIFIYSI